LLITNTRIIQFLLQNTSAIKRPIVEKNNIPVAIGFSEEIFS
ncbi:MAG: arsenate reductase, partial [Bacteroidetes bacterium]